MVCEDTLKIKNLPNDLSDTEKEDLLRHFGAKKVKIITYTNKQKSVAFAQFDSKEIAKSVLLRLHQIKILNSKLCVEYAKRDIVQDNAKINIVEHVKGDKSNFKKFINKLGAFNNSVLFYQPPPSHLKYVYPKPNRATINNIAHALASVPKFYTQVLHLMNRMNLPPPFSDIPDPPQVSIRHTQQRLVPVPMPEVKQKSSSESEMESDSDNTAQLKDVIPLKRKLPQKKVLKRPKFIKPPSITSNTTSKGINIADEIFDKVEILKPKIELKVTTSSLHENMEVSKKHTPSDDDTEDDKETRPTNTIITEEELNTNRIPTKDLNVLPIFKDYHPGAPTSRLYIKNIAKTIEQKDLEYIYKRYCSEGNSESAFNIRLMQEGRMKGQAFITLDTIQLAQQALEETNGYILKDRPLVVVFAKSAVQKKS